MIKSLQPVLIILLLVLASCIAGCGNAEAIRVYKYETTKPLLEKAVLKVVNSDPNIHVDTSISKVKVRRNTGNPNDTSTMLIPLT